MDTTHDAAGLERLQVETDEWIDKALDSLGWTRESLLKDEPEKRRCSVDPGHMVPENKLDQHEWYCSRIKSGYTRQELDADQSSKFFYENATTVVPVVMDDSTLRNILSSQSSRKDWSTRALPLTVERYLSELSAGERRAVYDYCIATAKATNKMISFPKEQLMFLEDQDDKTDDPNKDMPQHLRQLMQERDLKRKRQKYRAKNVHITQKSHTEIIREVLANQMELLHRRWNDDEKEKQKISEKEEEKFHSENESQHSERSQSHQQSHRSSERRRRSSRDREGGADDTTSRKRRRRSASRETSPDRHRSSRHRHKHHKHGRHKHSHRRDDDSRDTSRSKSEVSISVTKEEGGLETSSKEELVPVVKKEEDMGQETVDEIAHAT